MSSILNALKKAEKEGSVYKTSPGLTLNVQRIVAADPSADEVQKKSSKLPIAGAALVLLLIFAASFYYLSQPDSDKTPDSPRSGSTSPESTNPQVQHLSPAADSSDPTNPAQMVNRTQKPITSAPSTASKAAAPAESPQPQPVPPTATKPQTPPVKQKIAEQPTASPPKKMNSYQAPPIGAQTPETQQTQKPQIAEVSSNPPANESANSIQKLEDNSLQIHAISWSENSEQRIVVINTQVASEGEQVEEYRIVTIKADAVLLKKNGITYQLDFKN